MNPERDDPPSSESHHVSEYFREHDMTSNLANNEILEIVGEYIAELVDQFMDVHPERKPKVTEETIQSFIVVESKDLLNSACNICLEEYTEKDGEDKTVRKLPCKHIFHFTCIKSWLDQATNCPMCRFELPTDDPMFESFKKRKREQQRVQADIAELHDSMFS